MMTHRICRWAAGAVLATSWYLVVCGNTVLGAAIVFMTNDLTPTTSQLTRFDQGVETFSVSLLPQDSAFHGVAIHNGEVLVSDYRLEAIQRFGLDGTHLGEFAAFENPTFLETDSNGNVYTSHDSIGPPVATRFDSDGVATQTYVRVNPFGQFALNGIDADAAGNVYIVENLGMAMGVAESNLLKYSASGTLLESVALPWISGRDISIDEASNLLYMADSADPLNGIKIFDISGAVPSPMGNIATPTDSVIEGIHFAAESGNILATDFGGISNDPRGLEFSPSGVLLQEYRPATSFRAFDIVTYVPEPASIALVGLAMFMLGLRHRRWRSLA